ncbi:hypothetical protein BKA70DRAFT_1306622 [Coprinopsis sp. MPI-PUGE-AT-0042]|nr:hypothetical protein BKA70DRAFT_1306622 [Coprinopsis sp. MPI-PUGE-AT-0042]
MPTSLIYECQFVLELSVSSTGSKIETSQMPPRPFFQSSSPTAGHRTVFGTPGLAREIHKYLASGLMHTSIRPFALSRAVSREIERGAIPVPPSGRARLPSRVRRTIPNTTSYLLQSTPCRTQVHLDPTPTFLPGKVLEWVTLDRTLPRISPDNTPASTYFLEALLARYSSRWSSGLRRRGLFTSPQLRPNPMRFLYLKYMGAHDTVYVPIS